MKRPFAALAGLLVAAGCGDVGPDADARETVVHQAALVPDQTISCDVVVAGGSTAALAAALTSAREGAQTCLLEPVDWVGGQLTASGVPAIDFAWHRVDELDVGAIGKDPANLPSEFNTWMRDVGNPGNCWVSTNCFRPDRFHDDVLMPAVEAEPNLRLFLRTVVKEVDRDGATIRSLTAIERTPLTADDPPLSEQIADWYSVAPSASFDKRVLRFVGPDQRAPVVIDATEFGDVLALSDAPYLQGIEEVDGSTDVADDTCGQATVYPLVARRFANPVSEPDLPVGTPSFYDLGRFSWSQVWSYRRILSVAGGIGELSLQNWNPGNDYPFGYLLLSRTETTASAGDWVGGVDIDTLAEAEDHALGWHRWYAANAPDGVYIGLDRTVLGTAHGLSKLPYVRDTRRSVGLENFVLGSGHLRGPAAQKTGTRFADRIALGAYAIDVHPLETCSLAPYLGEAEGEPLPFFLPFRSLTNRDVANLLVAGKTMAQSFIANAATRLQPIEWTTGIGAGAAAAHMVSASLATTRDALADIAAVQSRIRRYAPLEWTIDGQPYPGPGELLPPVADRIYCPAGAAFDEGYGFCTSGEHAFGPFTRGMVEQCERFGGGDACTRTLPVEIAGRTLFVARWAKTFALPIRGTGPCPRGASRDPAFLNHCQERYWSGTEWIHDVFGPFPSALVSECERFGGGNACYSQRWSATFFRQLAARL